MNGSAKIIAVTSGKGGVGKTNTALNLAIALSRLKKRVCIFDADLGLANINILLGINPKLTIQDVITGDNKIQDIIIHTHENMQIIPGSSGIQQLAELNKQQIQNLIENFLTLSQDYDYFIIDTSAGISNAVLSFVMAAHESIVVVTKEPTSLTDGYALIKVITTLGHRKPIHILVNMVPSQKFGEKIFQKLFEVTSKHLSIKLQHFGTILIDPMVSEAVCKQKPVSTAYPNSLASKTYTSLGSILCQLPVNNKSPAETFKNFWAETLKSFKSPRGKKEASATPIRISPTTTDRISSKKFEERAKDDLPIFFQKLCDKVEENTLNESDFLEFTGSERSLISKIEIILDNYHQFTDMAFIAGENNFFKELDFESCIHSQNEPTPNT